MWDAFLKQRISSTQPFWVDSLCIAQTISHEKTFAIGAIDYIYRAASKVVVVLEDIATSRQKMTAILCSAEAEAPLECWYETAQA